MGFYSRASMSSALMNLKKIYGFKSLSVSQVPQQAGGPFVSSIISIVSAKPDE
jgi:hypothetical protein